MEHDGTSWRPLLFFNQVGCRQNVHTPVMAGGVPVNILVMRARNHHHLTCNPWALVFRTFPSGIVELGPELVPATFEVHRLAVCVCNPCAVEIRTDGLGRGYLRHGAVERPGPAVVLGRMAGLTSF